MPPAVLLSKGHDSHRKHGFKYCFINFVGGVALTSVLFKLQKSIERLAIIMCWIVAGLLGVMLFIVPIDGLGRYFFKHPLKGTLEFSESAIVMIIFLAAAYCEFTQGHIRVTFLFDRLSKKIKFTVRSLTSVLSTIYFFLLSWQSGIIAFHSFQIREISSGSLPIPLYIPKFFITLGSAVMFILLTLKLVNSYLEKCRIADKTEEIEGAYGDSKAIG